MSYLPLIRGDDIFSIHLRDLQTEFMYAMLLHHTNFMIFL